MQIEYLKTVEDRFTEYNKYSSSPFSKYKKNDVARDLHEGTLSLSDTGAHVLTRSKAKSPITLYQNVEIGYKLPGDCTISKLIGTDVYKDSILQNAVQKTWFYCWAEDKTTRAIADKHFDYVGSKITTFGEVIAIYFKGVRNHPFLDPVEKLTLKKLGYCDIQLIEKIHEKLKALDLNFKNHYSNYNKKQSWSAISLRGYYPDITRIEKPIEMSKKWKEEHKDEVAEIQDTELRKEFPEVDKLLEDFDGRFHRIRFMRLAPGGGELERHTDQVDPDSGGDIGKLARIHFPIKTNPHVMFTTWDLQGDENCVNMSEGEFWFLDTRKPHRAINGGTEERIHLVIDVEVTDKIKGILLNG